jgi:hypothetical protein
MLNPEINLPKISMNKDYSAFAGMYHMFCLITFAMLFHEAVLCPFFNIGIHGGDDESVCTIGWFGVYILPLVFVWFVMTFFAVLRARKIRQQGGSIWVSRSLTWPWKIILLIYLLGTAYTLKNTPIDPLVRKCADEAKSIATTASNFNDLYNKCIQQSYSQ